MTTPPLKISAAGQFFFRSHPDNTYWHVMQYQYIAETPGVTETIILYDKTETWKKPGKSIQKTWKINTKNLEKTWKITTKTLEKTWKMGSITLYKPCMSDFLGGFIPVTWYHFYAKFTKRKWSKVVVWKPRKFDGNRLY